MNAQQVATGDQAARLRQLVRQAGECDELLDRPPLVVVSCGRGGVGATTVSIQLARELARRGRRCLLAEANSERPALARRLDVPGRGSLHDALNGRNSLGDVAQPVGTHLHVVAGNIDGDATSLPADDAATSWRRALYQESDAVDIAIVDAGPGVTPWSAFCWRAADMVLLVTQPDRQCIVDTYALIKLAHVKGMSRTPLALMVNRCSTRRTALDVHRRIAGSCRRFLGETVAPAPHLLELTHTSESSQHSPDTTSVDDAAHSIADWLVQRFDSFDAGSGADPDCTGANTAA